MSFVTDNLRSEDLQHVIEALKKQELFLMEERALREAGEQKIQGQMEIMMEKLCSLQESMKFISDHLKKSVSGSEFFASSHTQVSHNTTHFLPEVKFPLFDGSNPRSWVRKCEKYFKLVKNTLVPENRVSLASLHFCGEAEVWLWSYMEGKSDVSWETLLEAVMERFDDIEPHVVVGEFKKLQQEGTVSEYVDKFEELMSNMVMMFGRELNDEFYVASFVSGLKDEIKWVVMAMRPESLHRAVYLAKLQESNVDDERRQPFETENYTYTPSAGSIRDHPKQIFAGPLIMRGEIENYEVRILIGSGSTHCFLDEEFAEKLQSERRYATPMIASFAGGGKIVSRVVCPNLKWTIQGNEFIHSVRVIKLRGCDMLLGGDWLRKHSPVGFDFTERKMTIDKDGKRIDLQAITENPELQSTCAQLFSITLTPLEEHEN